MQVQGRWIPATVVSVADMPHSYIVETANGKKYTRNRRHLLKCHQEDESSLDDYVPPESPQPEPVENPAQEEMMMRLIWGLNQHNRKQKEVSWQHNHNTRGRVIRPPARYKNFVKN